MKIKNLIFAGIICFTMSSISLGAGVGNSIAPIGDMDVAISVENNIIFDKDIDLDSTRRGFEYNMVNQAYGKFSLGITDYMNLYAKAGTSNNGDIKQRFADSTTVDIECEQGFFYGAGGNISYPFSKDLSLGIDLQYNKWECTVDEIEKSGEIASNISGQIKNEEVQAALFISYKINLKRPKLAIIPYAGSIYNLFESKSDEAIKYDTSSSTSNELNWELEGADNFGVLGGIDIVSGDNLIINIEGRFFHETALTTGVSCKF